MSDAELWHLVEAKRDDGLPTLFRIRELEPDLELDRIFVVELPYPTTDALSRLPNATAYRRLADLEEHWLRPACSSLGIEYVGTKTEDGSVFLSMYGHCDLNDLVAKLSPFDGALGFYDDPDPEWEQYGTLREQLAEAKALDKAKTKPAAKKKPAAAKKKPKSKQRA
jgi:hypothetical protein